MHNETQQLQSKTVDRFNQEKLYIQLTRIFLNEIQSGKWKLNQRIPSEEELCKLHKVSKITVRQAINNLSSDGYLIKIQGKGTFVTSTVPVVGLAMKTVLTEDIFGKEVSVEKRVLFRGIKKPSSAIEDYLKTSGDVYCVLIQRLAKGLPAYLEESFIPYHMLPGIEQVDVSHGPLYLALQEKALKKIFKTIQTVEIVIASSEYIRYLDATEGSPLLALHRLFLSSDNTPVAYTRFTGKSDRFRFQTEFERIR